MAVLNVNGGTINTRQLSYGWGGEVDIIRVLSGENTILTWWNADLVYTILAAADTSQVAHLGADDDKFYGGASSDHVHDGSGNDQVFTGLGRNSVYVGAGDDTYVGGSGAWDSIEFRFLSSDAGVLVENDNFAVTFDLAKTTAQALGDFGSDTVTGFEHALGGGGNDRLYGDANGNWLTGGKGNDMLNGRGGDDRLSGGEGGDTSYGGAGKDEFLLGELKPAKDLVRFQTMTDSSASTQTCDVITSFDKGGGATDDRIDLSLIDANPLVAGNQAFTFIAQGGFTAAAGEVRIAVTGGDSYVYLDTDADVAVEMVIKVADVIGLTAADFVL